MYKQLIALFLSVMVMGSAHAVFLEQSISTDTVNSFVDDNDEVVRSSTILSQYRDDSIFAINTLALFSPAGGQALQTDTGNFFDMVIHKDGTADGSWLLDFVTINRTNHIWEGFRYEFFQVDGAGNFLAPLDGVGFVQSVDALVPADATVFDGQANINTLPSVIEVGFPAPLTTADGNNVVRTQFLIDFALLPNSFGMRQVAVFNTANLGNSLLPTPWSVLLLASGLIGLVVARKF